MKRRTITDPRILAEYRKPAPIAKADDRFRQKPRLCLTCQNEFESSWCGERVCPKCKQMKVFR